MSGKIDQTQIARLKFDSEKNADRVSLVDLDLNIELSAEDGDSVITKKQAQLVPVQDGQVIDLSMFSQVMLVGGAEQASLTLRHEGQDLLDMTIYKGVIKEICLTEVLIKFSGQSVFLVLS